MSKDYIGPFGPESRTAGTEILHERTNICAGADTCDSRTVADEVLSAAVSAVDRQALAKRLEDVLRTTAAGQSSPRYRLLAEAGIAGLFPTEGEAG